MDPIHSGSLAALPTRHAYSSEIGQVFQSVGEHSDRSEFVLSEVEIIVSDDRQENFTLLFRAAIGLRPVQGIYTLENERLGVVELFLVPVKQDEDGVYLEAVINHFKAGNAEQ